MKTCLLLLALLGSAFAAALPNTCSKVIAGAGLSRNYNETIAHAIHSMTAEGLRLFNPAASQDNSVPTVNHDLKQEQNVLPYAPEVARGEDFITRTMNVIDGILTGLGTEDDGLGPNWSHIERVAHNFHMWDLWQRILPIFNANWKDGQASEDLCECLENTAENGIFTAVKWVADHYKSGTPITLLNRPIPKLETAEAWKVWKGRLLHYYTPAALNDAAAYLSCVAKRF